jgi:hypothetical protein
VGRWSFRSQILTSREKLAGASRSEIPWIISSEGCYDAVMSTDHIVSLLIAECDRLSRALEALQGSAKRRGRPPGSGKKQSAGTTVKAKRKLSAAGRQGDRGRREKTLGSY